jgi:hypothetical protein
MTIRFNAFVEEMIRQIDHAVCRENPALATVSGSLRALIVARELQAVGVAMRVTDPDGVEFWRPSQSLEARMGNSDVGSSMEIEVNMDFTEGRQIMRYVAAVHTWAEQLVEPAVETAVADAIAFNKGLVEFAGWNKNGSRKWVQTALGEKLDPIW